MLLSMEEFRAFQPKKPTYALFGWPLGHTMSPELHAQLFEASGQDAAYIGVAVPPDDLAEAFDLAKAKLRGINCTIPHKKAVIELLDGVDTAARDLHSVNTVAFRDGKAIGYNTDILGFSESLARDGVTLRGKKVFLFGTAGFGGSAEYFAKILSAVQAELDPSNTVVGTYMCQGRMPQSVRQRYEAMKQQPNPASNLDMLIENFDRALAHPDAGDLERLKQAVQ